VAPDLGLIDLIDLEGSSFEWIFNKLPKSFAWVGWGGSVNLGLESGG